MEQEKTFEVDVGKRFFLRRTKISFSFFTKITLDVEETARFLLWCIWLRTKGPDFPEFVKDNLEVTKTFISLVWGEGLFRFVGSLQEYLADYFEPEVSDQANNDENFKKKCYEKFANKDDAEEFEYDYQEWWNAVTA